MVRNQRDEKPLVIDTLKIQSNDGDGVEIDWIDEVSNGSANVTISNVAPSGVGTATISKWLEVRIAGVSYYIPMWT